MSMLDSIDISIRGVEKKLVAAYSSEGTIILDDIIQE
jgi:hypothetical protein